MPKADGCSPIHELADRASSVLCYDSARKLPAWVGSGNCPKLSGEFTTP